MPDAEAAAETIIWLPVPPTSDSPGSSPAAPSSTPPGTGAGAGTNATPSTPPTTAPGGNTGAGTSTPPAQAASTTLVVGRVTDATNLTVKRARYDARDASVRVDYVESQPSEIKLGMIVEIEAEATASGMSVAKSIAAHSFVEGRVERIDIAGRVLVVNGVTVSIPADTVFEGITGLSDATLRVNDVVEVHGFPAGQAGATATRVEKKA